MSEDLKPCPLCGAPLEIHVGFHLQWWTDCKRRCGFITESFKSKEEVIKACNRRAPLPRKEWKAAELHEIIEYLLVRLEEENADDCDCGTDEPGSCVICRAKAVLSGGGDDRWEKEAPVAPVRKWEADVVVGELGLEEYGLHGCATIYVKDLSPEVQDALNGRKYE